MSLLQLAILICVILCSLPSLKEVKDCFLKTGLFVSLRGWVIRYEVFRNSLMMTLQAIWILLFYLRCHDATKSDANNLIFVIVLTVACVYNTPLNSPESSDFCKFFNDVVAFKKGKSN